MEIGRESPATGRRIVKPRAQRRRSESTSR